MRLLFIFAYINFFVSIPTCIGQIYHVFNTDTVYVLHCYVDQLERIDILTDYTEIDGQVQADTLVSVKQLDQKLDHYATKFHKKIRTGWTYKKMRKHLKRLRKDLEKALKCLEDQGYDVIGEYRPDGVYIWDFRTCLDWDCVEQKLDNLFNRPLQTLAVYRWSIPECQKEKP